MSTGLPNLECNIPGTEWREIHEQYGNIRASPACIFRIVFSTEHFL